MDCKVKINVYDEVSNDNEIYVSPTHMNEKELSMNFHVNRLFTDKNNTTVTSEDKKHIYNCNKIVDFTVNNPTLNVTYYDDDELNEQKLINEYKQMNKKLKNRLKKNIIKKIYISIKHINKVVNILNNSLFDIKELNDKNKFTTDNINSDKMNHSLNEEINKHPTINFKTKKSFGKHHNIINLSKARCITSSTQFKKQLYDNDYYIQDYIKYVPNELKELYERILKMLYNSKDDDIHKKNRLFEIMSSNLHIYAIKNNLNNYKTWLNNNINRINKYPHMTLTDKVMGFNNIHKKIIKINKYELKHISWNTRPDSEIIFDEIYMVNTYSLSTGVTYDKTVIPHKLYYCIGFAICRNTLGKYNIFPTYDERIDIQNKGKVDIDESLKKYMESSY